MSESHRATAREIAQEYLARGDSRGWFEELYSRADGDASVIPWADLSPNPNLVAWFNGQGICGGGKKALKVGCGLGDDAEELAKRGFETTAFDISETAIKWCKQRFGQSRVKYVTADLFRAPEDWDVAFDFVVESYTLQVLPADVRRGAIRAVSRFVGRGGMLLVICRGREPNEPAGKMPWPLVRSELDEFKVLGLRQVSFEDYMDKEEPPVRRFRSVYKRD